MIRVTRANAEALIPAFRQAAKKTYFAAVDLEMSGLAVRPESMLAEHSPAQRYRAIMPEVNYFSPLELGLSLFYITS
jgi:hypothetical protein